MYEIGLTKFAFSLRLYIRLNALNEEKIVSNNQKIVVTY